jgi:hypothetical protein
VKLPRATEAIVPLQKLTEYLLSESHPVGSFKAVFFRAIGFSDASIDVFEKCLLELARYEDVIEIMQSPHGIKYVIDGKIATPLGGMAAIRTVWIIESDQDRPRFVTAYPK